MQELHERIKKAAVTFGAEVGRPSEAEYAAEMGCIRKDIVNFHGEMVLLVNYSSINYTGFIFHKQFPIQYIQICAKITNKGQL